MPGSNEPFLTRLGRDPRFQTAWVIWSCLWALFWITAGWFVVPVFNLGMFAASVAVAVAGRPGRPSPDPGAWHQPPPTPALGPRPLQRPRTRKCPLRRVPTGTSKTAVGATTTTESDGAASATPGSRGLHAAERCAGRRSRRSRASIWAAISWREHRLHHSLSSSNGI
jgi:hypothetical protein